MIYVTIGPNGSIMKYIHIASEIELMEIVKLNRCIILYSNV